MLRNAHAFACTYRTPHRTRAAGTLIIKTWYYIHNMNKPKTSGNTIALNKKARHDFTIEQTYEAGIALEGWEVKSLRAGKVQITESYVIVKQSQAFLLGAHITPLNTASTHIQPEPTRTRKLLMHRSELDKLIGLVERRGFTLLILSLYWKNNHIKAQLALAKGKQTHDKRQALKEKDWQREQQRNFKQR